MSGYSISRPAVAENSSGSGQTSTCGPLRKGRGSEASPRIRALPDRRSTVGRRQDGQTSAWAETNELDPDLIPAPRQFVVTGRTGGRWANGLGHAHRDARTHDRHGRTVDPLPDGERLPPGHWSAPRFLLFDRFIGLGRTHA